ncbi:MAG TPA: hypothetical protein VH987_03195 [Candidatus Limnocylindria bacterium]|jgi:hypothetical protein
MSKSTVTRLFIGSAIAVIAGLILGLTALWAAFANGMFVMHGHDVIGIQSGPGAWFVLGLGILAGLVIMGGLVGGLVSWIGALLNTAALADKTWFILLLVLGLLSFGLVAMIAYVIGGPDGTRQPVAPAS